MMFFLLLSLFLPAQKLYKELPDNLKEEISRRDFRQARKAYEEEIDAGYPISIPPIERIVYDVAPVRDSRLPGISSITSWGQDIMMPRNIRDRVVDECANYLVVICTVDSGVDEEHKELRGNWWMNGSNYSGDEKQHWHGTHVAGIIWQMVGEVASKRGTMKMKDVQFLNSSGSGSFSAARNMVKTETNIFDLPAQQGVGVIFNNSWGYNGGPIQSFEELVEESLDKGLIWIGSAGNSGKEGPGYPGMSPFFTSVASVQKNLTRSPFSTMNGHVDVAAPGSSINSTMPDDKQGSASGTSMAAPFISGLAGLAYGKYGPILQGRNMYIYLKYICDDLPPQGRDIQTGYGLPYVINMLETDPCHVPGISCDDNPAEEPPAEEPEDPVDEPDEPAEEPPAEDPEPPAPAPELNTVTFTAEDGFFMPYRRESDQDFTFLYVPSITVTRTAGVRSELLYDETLDLVRDYFRSRAIVIRSQDDYMDAIYWVGQFLEYVTRNAGKPIQVLEVEGRDQAGRKGSVTTFDRADIETIYKAMPLDGSGTIQLSPTPTNLPKGIQLINYR